MLNEVSFKFLSAQQMQWIQSRAKTIIQDYKEEEKWNILHKQNDKVDKLVKNEPPKLQSDVAVQVTPIPTVPKKRLPFSISLKPTMQKEPDKEIGPKMRDLNSLAEKLDKLEFEFLQVKRSHNQINIDLTSETVPKASDSEQESKQDKKMEPTMGNVHFLAEKLDKLEVEFLEVKRDFSQANISQSSGTMPKTTDSEQESNKSQFFQKVLLKTFIKDQAKSRNIETRKSKTVTFSPSISQSSDKSSTSSRRKSCLKSSSMKKTNLPSNKSSPAQSVKSKLKTKDNSQSKVSKKTESSKNESSELNHSESVSHLHKRISEIEEVENAVRRRLDLLKQSSEKTADGLPDESNLHIPKPKIDEHASEDENDQLLTNNTKVEIDQNTTETKKVNLFIEPNVLYSIDHHRKLFQHHLQKNAHKEVDTFNPWSVANSIAEYIMDDCIEEVAQELNKIPSSFIMELYEKEFS